MRLPVDPCGLIVDVARVCGYYRVRAFTDDARYCRIRTYRVTPGTPCLPIPHVFGYGRMMFDDLYSDPAPGQLGCQLRQYKYSKGELPRWWQDHTPDPRHFCGRPSQWVDGSTLDPDQQLDWGSQPWGGSVCCLGWIGIGGDADGGAALQLGGGDQDGGRATWSTARVFSGPSDHLWEVPEGMTTLSVFLFAAGGSGGTGAPIAGGYPTGGGGGGAAWSPSLAVTPGELLWFHCGRAGVTPLEQAITGADGPGQSAEDTWVARAGVHVLAAQGGAGGSTTGPGFGGAGGTGLVGAVLHSGGHGGSGGINGGGGGSGAQFADGDPGQGGAPPLDNGGGLGGYIGGGRGGDGGSHSPFQYPPLGFGGGGGGNADSTLVARSGGTSVIVWFPLVYERRQIAEGGDLDGGPAVQELHVLQLAAGGDEDGGPTPQGIPVVQLGSGGDADGGPSLQAEGPVQLGTGGDADGGQAIEGIPVVQLGTGGDADGGTSADPRVAIFYGTAFQLWTVPAGVTSITVRAFGPGAGGGAGGGGVAGGGGGAGAYAEAIAYPVSPGDVLIVVWSGGGSGGVGGDGVAGGACSVQFGATSICRADGGQGGLYGGSGGAGGAGGAGGSTSPYNAGGDGGGVYPFGGGGGGGGGGGAPAIAGGTGAAGTFFSGGAGGTSTFGVGGAGAFGGVAGGDGVGPGGGGGGGSDVGTDGGAGAPGLILIYY